MSHGHTSIHHRIQINIHKRTECERMVLKMVAVVIVLPLLSGGVDAMEHVDHVHVDALHGFPVKKQQRFRANGEIVTYEQPVVLELRTR